MTLPISAGTRLIALLGNPVEHSLSPAFQNAAITAAGLDAVYVALRCEAEDVRGLVRGIALAGGGGNVTIPHKAEAARSLDQATEAVRATGVCNTFWSASGLVWGDNTDVAGVAAAVASLLGRSPRGARVLMLGAGGSARAVAYALLGEEVAELVVLNRSRERAEELRSTFSRYGPIVVESDVQNLRGERFDLVVNTTSLGLGATDPAPLPLDSGVEIGAALDLVYSPSLTPWVRSLRQHEIPAADGLEMLLHQGAAAFVRWFGVEPSVEAMRAAVGRGEVTGDR